MNLSNQNVSDIVNDFVDFFTISYADWEFRENRNDRQFAENVLPLIENMCRVSQENVHEFNSLYSNFLEIVNNQFYQTCFEETATDDSIENIRDNLFYFVIEHIHIIARNESYTSLIQTNA